MPDKLTRCVRIVGVRTHDIPMRVRIEVLNGELLHLRKHIRTKMVQHALRNRCHNPRMQEGRHDYEGVYGHHHDN